MVLRVFLFMLIAFIFSSCGLDSDDNSANCNLPSNGNYIKAFAKLGNLANAEVKIFKILDDGSLILYDEVFTSSGDSLEKIGVFGIKIEEIEDNDLFLIQVSGGLDWDANDDGVKDEEAVENKGIIRAFATGKEIKELNGKLTVSAVSEIVYESLAKDFKYFFDKKNFIKKLNEVSKNILLQDLNNDGKISNTDILLFDPVTNRDYLSKEIFSSWEEVVNNIHNGEKFLPILNLFFEPITFIPAGFTYKLRYDRGYLVLGEPRGVFVYKLFNILSPEYISAFNTLDWVWNIDIKDNLIFLAGLSEGFKILSISESEKLSLVSEFYPITFTEDDFPSAESISVDGNDFIVTANGPHGFSVYEIKDPSSPSLILTYKPCGNVKDAVLKDSFLYVLCDKSGLQVYKYPSLDNIFSYSIKEELTDLEVTSNKLAISVFDGKVYLFDISQPDNPTLSGVFKWNDDFIFSLRIKDNMLFVPLYYGGVAILDISDTANPKKKLNIKIEGNPYAVDYSNGLLFVGTKIGVYIFDLDMFKSF